LLLRDVVGFDWWGDRRVVISRQGGTGEPMVLMAVDSEDVENTRELFRGAHAELDVAPDRSAVAFCAGTGHLGMKPVVLKLELPSEPDGLPRAEGEPEFLYDLELNWHVHMGGWSDDSKRIVVSYDRDYSDIYEVVEAR
jgi:hypothetical protein